MTGHVQGQNFTRVRKQKERFSKRRGQFSSGGNLRFAYNGRIQATKVHRRQERNRSIESPSTASRSHVLEELICGLVDLGSFQFGEFTLASGQRSSLYVDLRLIVSQPSLMQEAARVYANVLETLKCDRVAGIPYAALPIGAAVSLESGVPLIYNRKESKKHGLAKVMEGLWYEGERVVIIEDVITTGGSILTSVELFRDAGLVVEDAIVFLDRQQGGVEFLKSNGVNVHCILNLHMVQEILNKTGQCCKIAFPESSCPEHSLAKGSSESLLNG